MSDLSVSAALRSDSQLVVIEAPAGCGKTHQAADYGREICSTGASIRPLMLTHTHAACATFANRMRGIDSQVEVRTLDSIVSQIAAAYHVGLDLPQDAGAWARDRPNGHAELAQRVSILIGQFPMIARSIAQRHQVVVCDEHQDSSGDQHAIVMSLLDHGARIRIFADPMQRIFKDPALVGSHPPVNWGELIAGSDAFEQLDTPHRWSNGCSELGQWTLDARESLKRGEKINLQRNLPPSVKVVIGENLAQRRFDFRLASRDRREIDVFARDASSLLILTHFNQTAMSLCSFFNRRIQLWEGHSRPALENLVEALTTHRGQSLAVAVAVVEFMGAIGKGFSPSAFGNAFIGEVREGCRRARRGRPGTIQELARMVVAEPDHRGAAKVFRRVSELKSSDPSFAGIEMDCRREFSEAIRIGEFDTPNEGFHELTHRRTYSRPTPPTKAISTIHKAKGLECDSVILMPCDSRNFPDRPDSRCLLYVALSRPKRRLLLVFPPDDPSPLFKV